MNAVSTSVTSNKISWTSVSSASGFQVFRSLSATETYTWLANAFTNSYTKSELTTGTTCYYKVKARNTTKSPTVYSAYSSVIAAKPVLKLSTPFYSMIGSQLVYIYQFLDNLTGDDY